MLVFDDVTGGDFGSTTHGDQSEVKTSRKDTDTAPHEVGHTLNLGHFLSGLMKEIDKEGKITRESIVTKENVQQIIDFGIGKIDMNSPTAPIEKAKTTLTNPQELKVEGTIVEKK